MSSQSPLVLVDRARSDVAVVTLNQPDRLNALSFALVEELHQALDDIERDNSCRVVIVTGAGRGFCSGLDLLQYGGSPVAEGTSGPRASMLSQARIASLPTKIHRLQQPVIAAVNGPAIGGGFALALACDLRVASPTALFRSQFIRMGLGGCDIGISYLLPRLIGASRAAELLLTSRDVGADEALRIGMVSTCADDVLAAAFELAETMTSFGSFALPMTKEVFWSNVDAPSIESAIHLENRTQTLAATSGEIDDAVAAFLARRPVTTTGVDEVDQ
jgi:enoyl-CoA hydratase/carnithine racemase